MQQQVFHKVQKNQNNEFCIISLLFLVVNVLSCKTLQYTTKRRRFQEKNIRKTLKINNLNNLAERIIQ